MNFRGNFGNYQSEGMGQEEMQPGAFRRTPHDQPPYQGSGAGMRHTGFGQGPTEFIEVLMVAEKPSIARTIVDSLTGGKYATRKGK
jgi:hypothetical protein